MKILVLGANGQVGHELVGALAATATQVFATTRDGSRGTLTADLADPESLRGALETANADVIVNAAAYTAVDRAEDDVASAYRINAEALAEIGAWAKPRGACVVHYSTDYVFDGTATRPYREDDMTAPLGVYGLSKLAGEHALRDSGCDHVILRTAWVYAARAKNFLRTMLKVGAERDEVRVVDDQSGTPTPAHFIAAATARVLVQARASASFGTYHLCAGGECSWFDFAAAIFARAHSAGLIGKIPHLTPIPTSAYPTRARRPAYSVLDTSKIRTAFGVDCPSWQTGLDAVIAELAAAHPE